VDLSSDRLLMMMMMMMMMMTNASGRTMSLGSTQLLTEISTRNFLWGAKAAGTTLPSSCSDFQKKKKKKRSWKPQPPGVLGACLGVNIKTFRLYLFMIHESVSIMRRLTIETTLRDRRPENRGSTSGSGADSSI
jgi:hypothetical protein